MTTDTKAVDRCNIDQTNDYPNTKAVARCNFTPYGMVVAVDGHYVSFTDHERVVGELKEERVRWFERAGEYLKRAQTAEDALAASRAEVEGVKRDAERYRWLRSGENMDSATIVAATWDEGLDSAIDAAMEKGNV